MGTHIDQFRHLARYNAAFNEQLFNVCETLTDEERRQDRGAFFRSIHATLNHILLADRIWLARFRDNGIARAALQDASLIELGPGVQLSNELYADWGELRLERRATDAVITAWAASFDDDTLSTIMRYANSRGDTREHPAWIAITHAFNHQTHHRGQVTTLLSQSGHDPGVTDFLVFALRPD